MKPKFSYKEVVRLLLLDKYSQREIARAAGCSDGSVGLIKRRLRQSGIDGPTALEMSESELRGLLLREQGRLPNEHIKKPDYAKVDEELAKNRKLTLAILWEEYAQEAHQEGLQPYMYSFFVQKYREWQNFHIPSLRVSHTPGDKLEVDWAGDTMQLVDPYTGELTKVYLFVATLPYSQYTYIEPTLRMDIDAWIDANINALHFFGGSPRIIVPDNLKTAVVKNTGNEVVLNRTYSEFADHYHTAIIPTAVAKPKHKPSVEGNVGKIGERIILMLRKHTFFSLDELKDAVYEKLEDLNSRPFKKRTDGSRKSVFEEKEKHLLTPLPTTDYEIARWEVRTVAPDYRVSIDNVTYSVPYGFIGQKVDVRVGRKTISIFCSGERIATHPRSFDKGSDIKQKSHQPRWHSNFLERSGERFRTRAAEEIGPFGSKVVDSFLSAGRTEEEGYRACASLLNLLERYSQEHLENACERACDIAKNPSLKAVKILLRTQPERDEMKDALKDYAILRNDDYYTDKEL